MKKLLLFFSIFLLFSAVSCSDNTEDGGKSVMMVELSHINMILYEGQSYSISATVLPLDAEERELTWYSSEPEVCTVEDGLVTAHREGISVITAKTANGTSASVKIEVEKIEDIKSFYMSELELSLGVGDTHTLKAKTKPSSASASLPVIWSSSDESVATVDAGGTVTAHSRGKCLIFADISDVARAVCSVSVNGVSGDVSALVDISVRGLPEVFETKDYAGNTLTRLELTAYEVERELTADGVTVTLLLKGKKTFDRDGDNAKNSVAVVMDLYMEDDVHCDKWTLRSGSAAVGDEVVLEFRFNAVIKQEKREFYVLLREEGSESTE